MSTQDATTESKRRSASQILDAVKDLGHEELGRTSAALAFSGVAGGISMGLTALGVAIMRVMTAPTAGHEWTSYLLYPLGFIAVIIGRGQLFTENTLYPVVLILDEHKHVVDTLRLWSIVFVSNVFGALVFAALVTQTQALEPDFKHALVQVGTNSLDHTFSQIFWTGVVGGWIIALVAWMVTASHWTISQVVITYLLTFLVGAGHFAHCIAGSGEALAAVLGGAAPVSSYLHWIAGATLGNITGGVFMVSMLNWGQVTAGEVT